MYLPGTFLRAGVGALGLELRGWGKGVGGYGHG